MRSSPKSRVTHRLALVFALFTFPFSTPAHRLDEYLQATLVSIEHGEVRLKINLTPGVEVADHVLPLIDHNGDGQISTNEASAYSELLKHDLIVRLDGHKVPLKLTTFNFPELTELQTGWGIIQLEFSADIGPLPPGVHKLSIKNKHLPGLSVYLLNAAQPRSVLVHITKQRRNKTQSTGEIQFTIDKG